MGYKSAIDNVFVSLYRAANLLLEVAHSLHELPPVKQLHNPAMTLMSMVKDERAEVVLRMTEWKSHNFQRCILLLEQYLSSYSLALTPLHKECLESLPSAYKIVPPQRPAASAHCDLRDHQSMLSMPCYQHCDT